MRPRLETRDNRGRRVALCHGLIRERQYLTWDVAEVQ